MTVIRHRIMVFLLLGNAVLYLCTDRAQADSLRATVAKRSFLLYEPIPVEVTLHFDDPVLVDWDDPQKAMKQLRRLPQRLYVELCDSSGNSISRALLGGAAMRRAGNKAKAFPSIGLAFFGMPKNPGETSRALESGDYTIVVKANAMESNTVPVELLVPEGPDADAAELFRATLPGGALFILAQEGDAGVLNRFEDLARDYPDTVYGKYARVSLALLRYRETFASHNNKGGAAVWAPVVHALARAEGIFADRHPLRERVLFHLAIARALSGDYAGSRQSAAALNEVYPYGRFGARSEQLGKEIDELEKK